MRGCVGPGTPSSALVKRAIAPVLVQPTVGLTKAVKTRPGRDNGVPPYMKKVLE